MEGYTLKTKKYKAFFLHIFFYWFKFFMIKKNIKTSERFFFLLLINILLCPQPWPWQLAIAKRPCDFQDASGSLYNPHYIFLFAFTRMHLLDKNLQGNSICKTIVKSKEVLHHTIFLRIFKNF